MQLVLRRYCPVMDGGNGQSIGFTIVCSWLTDTGSCSVGYFSSITEVVDN